MGIYLRKMKIVTQKDIYPHPKPKCPLMGEWLEIVVYIHNGILFSHKKEEILLFVTTWMDLLSETIQTEKDK